MNFAKYHGLGNDFIIVDNTHSEGLLYAPEQAIKLCNRNVGIGADGVIFALPPSHGCDYTMRIYNSDGTEPQMCGNGIRCLARYLARLEIQPSNTTISYKVWTKAGVISAVVNSDGTVAVDMGQPTLTSAQIPTLLIPNLQMVALPGCTTGAVDAVVDADMTLFGVGDKQSVTLRTTAVSMGNPHSVMCIVVCRHGVAFKALYAIGQCT